MNVDHIVDQGLGAGFFSVSALAHHSNVTKQGSDMMPNSTQQVASLKVPRGKCPDRDAGMGLLAAAPLLRN